jgi:hypothetical protein
MLHVGTEEYYRQVAARAAGCDLVLAEGVRSRAAAHLLSIAQALARVKRLGLVSQQSMDTSGFREKIVGSDLSEPEFDGAWREMPLHERLLLRLAVPVYVAYMRLVGTKEFLASQLALDDLPSRDEVLAYGGGFEALDRLVTNDRERRLLQHLERLHQQYGQCPGQPMTVGVLWGARHMRAVTRYLMGTLKYRVVGAEWLTVFPL